ncbi:MAG: hypothetical protein ACRYFX_07495 [Janthinobacterium lividum]
MLSTFFFGFFQWLTLRTAGRHWCWLVVAGCVLAAILGQMPPYRHTFQTLVQGATAEYDLRNFLQQVAHPFQPLTNRADSHAGKMVFRLTLPLLARVLHLSLLHVFLAQFALGVLMYYRLVGLLARLVADRPTAALLALGLSGTYFGSAFAYDLFGYFDAFAYALLVLLLVVRSPVVILLLVFSGGFIDERLLLAGPLVAFWYGVAAFGWQAPPLVRYLFTRRAGALYAGVLAYGTVRLALAHYYQLPTYTGLVGLDALLDNLHYERLSLGYLFGWKAYWLLLLLAGLLLGQRQTYGLLLLALGCAAPIFAGSSLVTDTTRSLAYGIPAVFIAVSLLARSTTRTERRYVALGLAVATLAMPSYHLLGHLVFQSPFYQLALRMLL